MKYPVCSFINLTPFLTGQLRETDAGAVVVRAADDASHQVGEVANRAARPAVDVRGT